MVRIYNAGGYRVGLIENVPGVAVVVFNYGRLIEGCKSEQYTTIS